MASTRLLKTFNDSFKSLSDLVITLLVPGTESACSAAAPAAPRASGNKVQHTQTEYTLFKHNSGSFLTVFIKSTFIFIAS